MMSFDESFEIQSGDQDDQKFILLANCFCCHLESEYTINNVQTCHNGAFLSHKITQWNGVIAFSKNVPLNERFYL